MLVGLRILFRFSQALPASRGADDDVASLRAPRFDVPGVEIAGFAGGVTNGLVGAWGPVVTPFLLHRGLPPRYAIGSVNTAEVAVAVVSAGTLITALGRGGIDTGFLLAMLIGGVVAAPLAAYVRTVGARLGCWGSPLPGCCSSPRRANSRRRTTLLATGGSPTSTIPVVVGLAALRPRISRWFRGQQPARGGVRP